MKVMSIKQHQYSKLVLERMYKCLSLLKKHIISLLSLLLSLDKIICGILFLKVRKAVDLSQTNN